MRSRTTTTASLLAALLLAPAIATAAEGDAEIQHALGRAALAGGDEAKAYRLFKAACLAEDGHAGACLEWAALAEQGEGDKDVKRALGSAVMLDPENVRARFALAVLLLGKQDWTWAIEHLDAGLAAATDAGDRALLRYYMGYALFKEGDLEEARKLLLQARVDLPAAMRQRVDYYLGLLALAGDDVPGAADRMERAAEGPDEEWSQAAQGQLESWTAFPRPDGFSAVLSASFGLNTHPASAFLDSPGTDSLPALQSIFRGDVIFGAGRYDSGLQANVTVYREQNWAEVGDPDPDAEDPGYGTGDFNLTLFIAQAAWIGHFRAGGLEQQLRVGIDGETQFLDYPPVSTPDGGYAPGTEPFGLFAWATGGRVWWAAAKHPNSVWGLRLKAEVRPNHLDRDRSTIRTRLRALHTHHLLERALRLRVLVGMRYDRSYKDQKVIKYDRLLPELEAELRWRTPAPRLWAVFSGLLRYNWYLNSRQNGENSFRPDYLPVNGATDAQNELWKAEYYDLTRRDLEWEVQLDLQVDLWKGGMVALVYQLHKRVSNIDDAPTPFYEGARLPAPEYGYTRHQALLELRQRF